MSSIEKTPDYSEDQGVISYEVGPLDTLHSIALKYNMTTGDLLKLNNLPKTYRIYAGQQLLVNSLSGNSNSVKIFSVPETRKVFVPGGIASPHMEPSSTSVSKVIPVLSTIRQQRDRQYGIEWPRSGNSSVGLSTQPLSFKRNLKYLAVEEKIETKNILNEHVHYYVNNHNNVLGELILLPKSLIFEPEVDDPIVKQLGMVLCQFQYDIKDIIDIKALEPNELFDSMLSQDLTSQRDFGSVEGKGPRFLKIKVQLKESTHKDILVLINRRSSFLFYDKLKSLLSSVETEHRVSNSVKIPISNNQSLFAPSPISMSASPTSSLLSVSPKNDLLTQQTIKDEDLAPVPTLSSPSSIVENEEDLRWLASILPNRYQNSKWNLAYSTDIHGTSLQTFYNRTKKKGPSYLIIEDEDGFVFGSFVSESWECQKGYYGTGETYLFTILPSRNLFSWSGLNDYFVLSRETHLAIGGGSRYGLWLDSNLLEGSSAPCDTFLNSTLSCQEDFKCLIIEVWTLES